MRKHAFPKPKYVVTAAHKKTGEWIDDTVTSSLKSAQYAKKVYERRDLEVIVFKITEVVPL